METETTYTDIQVEVTIGFSELSALIRDGEILAHPENSPSLGFVYDQHNRAAPVAEEYEKSEDAEPFVLSERDLIDLLNGESAEWDDRHPAPVNVVLRYEAVREEGDGPQLTPVDFL